MSIRKFAILAGVAVFAGFGDASLARGMRSMPPVSVAHLGALFSALANPWVIFGILLLLGFFSAYLSALSFADLTYVLPATSISYVIMALLGRFFLHEHVSVSRWIGVALITLGVGFVAGGPSLTVPQRDRAPEKVGSRS